MRYIYYIILIIVGLTVLIGYELLHKQDKPKEAAIIINDRVITTDEFNKLYASCPADLKEKNDFINSLITKELLIQESQKEGIDKEESFRNSLQNFYEQSLIKLLMDRKYASIQVSVTDDEINKYIALMNKKYHITIFNFKGFEEAEKGIYRNGETKTMSILDMSRDIRDSIISLNEKETTKPIKITCEHYIVIQLNKIETIPAHVPSESERVTIKKLLTEEKKEQIINDWINDLREKAFIKIIDK